MRRLGLLPLLVLAGMSYTSFGSGFALYEPSARAHALGNAAVGKAVDASANFINPATLSDITNITVTVGFVTEHPRGAVDVNGCEQTMDPGLFWLPHFQLAVPLPFDFTFGLGCEAEWGLGSSYDEEWSMAWNSQETTVQGLVLNPNLSYAITEDWSVAAGLRWLYFSFEQYALPQGAMNGANYGTLDNRLWGDNRFRDFGWQLGTRYKVLKNLALGLVYKSEIDVGVDGKVDTEVRRYDYSALSSLKGTALYPAAQQTVRRQLSAAADANTGSAAADLRLPQSITGGFNWDITDTWHLGGAVAWTQWSVLDRIVFDLPAQDKITNLDWRDTWRFSIAPSWDFYKDWTAMLSYVYDMDCTSATQESTMLPPANRHIASCGLAWRCWAGLELALSYSCIFMDGRDMQMTDSLGKSYDMYTCWGFCHAVGFSVTYRF